MLGKDLPKEGHVAVEIFGGPELEREDLAGGVVYRSEKHQVRPHSSSQAYGLPSTWIKAPSHDDSIGTFTWYGDTPLCRADAWHERKNSKAGVRRCAAG
jgi:hypothetical protein